MDSGDKKNTMLKYIKQLDVQDRELNVRDSLKRLIENLLHFETIDEQKSKSDLGSMKVLVTHERDSYETSSTYRVYLNVVLYIDRKYTQEHKSAIRIGFLNDFKRMLEFNMNNLNSIHRVYIAGTESIEVNERVEGFKILLSLNKN